MPMARNEQLRALREQAKKLERNAGKKMSRLRNSDRPVELAGTKFDVRKGAKNISSMRTRDLQVHIRRLTEFNSRKSRYMATESGPAGPEQVNKFMRAQNRLNRQRKANLEKYGKLKTALGDETIGQKWAKLEPAQRHMADPSANNPFREVDKLGIKYKTPEALIKMAEKFEKQSDPKYRDQERIENRRTLEKILDVIPSKELEFYVQQMTDEQFDLMWFDPDFMNNQGLMYAQAIGYDKGELTAGQLEAFEDTINAGLEESLLIAKWALSH